MRQNQESVINTQHGLFSNAMIEDRGNFIKTNLQLVVNLVVECESLGKSCVAESTIDFWLPFCEHKYETAKSNKTSYRTKVYY